jgi:hypothetical protein
MEKIWFTDLGNFISEKTFDKFFPSASMTYTEKLNSIFRLSIYFSIVVIIIKKDANVLFIPIFTAIFSYFLHSNAKKNKKNEEEFLEERNLYKDPYTSDICYKPTSNNPFMNVLMSDYSQNPKRPKACNLSKGNIKKLATKYFNKDLYRDVGDIFQKNASDRNFITMPSTSIPNSQDDFLKFAYPLGKTCKDGNGDACVANTFRTILE